MWATLIIVVAPMATVGALAVRMAQKPPAAEMTDNGIDALHSELLSAGTVSVTRRR